MIAVILSGWLEHRGVSPAFAGYCVVLIAAFALTKLQIGRLSRARAYDPDFTSSPVPRWAKCLAGSRRLKGVEPSVRFRRRLRRYGNL